MEEEFVSSTKQARKRRMKKCDNTNVTNTGRHDLPILYAILEKAGYVIEDGTTSNKILVDQAVFQRRLKFQFKDPTTIGVDDFVKSFEEYIQDKKRLNKCLLGTITDESCESARYHTQGSLAHLLAEIDVIQPEIAKVLLERATELSYEDGDDDQVCLPRLIFSQLCACDITNKDVAEKVFEILGVLSFILQKELISLLPRIFSVSVHDDIAKHLCDLLMEKQDLSVDIVNSLANMDLKQNAIQEVKKVILKSVQSAKVDDLPVLLTFLLQDLQESMEAYEMATQLRSSIDLMPSTYESSTPIENSPGNKTSIDVLVLDSIIKQCASQNLLWEAWIKAIDKVNLRDEHKPLDLFVLIGLVGVGNEKCEKEVETTFREKIKKDKFSSSLIEKSFKSHPNILKQYFEELLSIGFIFLQSNDCFSVEFGSCLFINSFLPLEKFCKREMITSLINLVSYGTNILTMNAGLDTLVGLVEKDAKALAEFSNFLQSLLDRLEIFSLLQIKKIYFILNRLAYQGGNDGSVIQDELHIIIAKQLFNSEILYQKMGVVGCLVAAKEMSGSKVEERLTITSSMNLSLSILSTRRSSRITTNPSLAKKAISLFEIMNNRSGLHPEVQGLFWDELSRAIQMTNLDNKIEDWIEQNVTSNFENECVVDYSDDIKSCSGTEVEAFYALDELTDDSIIINLTAMVIKEEQMKKGQLNTRTEDSLLNSKASALTLSSFFRLLRICVHFRDEGNLEEIDALLVCGLTMPSMFNFNQEKLKELSSEELNLLCTCTFHCINWFREVVNAFAPVSSAESQTKVLQRISDIIDLMKKLEAMIVCNPDFKPPCTLFDLSDSSQQATFSIQVTTQKQSVNSKRGRKRKANNDDKENISQTKKSQVNTCISPTNNQTPAPSSNTEKELIKNGTVDMSVLKPYFRELDLTTFILLECGLKITQMDDTNNVGDEVPKLKPVVLNFLLEDLLLKLKHILPATKSTRLSALKVMSSNRDSGYSNLQLYTPCEVASCMAHMLPNFCSLIEDCNNYFESNIDKLEESADGDSGLESEQTLVISTCMLNLIKIISVIFSWSGFKEHDNLDLLEEALHKIGVRLNVNNTSKSTFFEKTKSCFLYLSKFEAFLPTLDSALALVNLLETIASYSQESTLSAQVSEMAEMFLQRSWKSASDIKDKGTKRNNYKVQKLLDAYFTRALDIQKCLEFLTNTPLKQLRDSEDRNAESEDFPTLNKSTFSTYYSSLMKYLVEFVKNIDVYKPDMSADVAEEIFRKWISTSSILKELVTLVKVFEARTNVKTCIISSKKYLELFLRNCIPCLQAVFKENSNEVLVFLKSIQQSTRFLQNCVYHARTLKDPALTKHIPFMRKYFNLVLSDVKLMLTANKCVDAFWVGSLKIRNLDGEEVPDDESEADEDDETDMEIDKKHSSDTEECQESETY